jgi:hypothetical protein
MKTYTVDKYIGERLDNGKLNKSVVEIIHYLTEEKRMVNLISGLGTGKSDFILKLVRKTISDNDFLKVQLIVVTSGKRLTENLVNRSLSDDPNDTRKAIPCNGDYKKIQLDDDYSPVVSTPESFYKVKKACEELGRMYYIVYDEVHEVPLKGAKFRRSLNNPFKAFKEELCFGMLGLTATPDNVKVFGWDETIKIKAKNPNVKLKRLDIINGVGDTAVEIANKILYIRKKLKDKKIVVRINNKNKIEDIRKLLSKYCEDVGVWYVGQQDNKYKQLLDEAIQNKVIELPEILLTTCLVDAGVEIFSNDKPIIIDYFDENSTLIESLQFIGRFRNGVKNVFFLMGYKALEIETNVIPFKKCYQEQKELAEVEYKSLIGITYKMDVFNCSYTKTENNIYSYYIDETKIVNKAFSKFIRQYFIRPNLLKSYLEDHETFIVEKVVVNKLGDENYLEAEEEAYKEEKKLEKKRKVELTKELKKKIAKDKGLRRILMLPVGSIDKNDLWIYEANKELYEHFRDEKEEDIKMIHYISEIKKLEPEEVLLMYYDKKKKDDIQEIIIERQIQNVKRIYHATDKPVTIGQTNATKCIPLYNEYYFIRLWVKKKDPKEIHVRMGERNKKELLEWLNDPKKKRYLSKTSESALEKYLNHIYHFDNQSRISSVKEY